MRATFILPNNNPETHMKYVLEVAKSLGVDTFIERDRNRNKLGNFFLSILPIRFVWILFLALYWRMKGVKYFYIHYSFIAIYAVKCVTTIFGGKIFYWNCGIPWQYKRSFWREKFERRAYKLIDFLVTGSESLIEGYSNYYDLSKQKIRIIPNWIDLKEVNKTKGIDLDLPDKKIVLFVHKLVPRKGSNFLPAIADALPDDTVLVVLGDGPDRDKSENIIYKGFVPNGEVGKYLLAADVFILPSEEEGFPHSLLEAMAYDVPFVVFDVGGVRGMVPVNEQEFVVKFGEIDRFIEKVKLRLKNNKKGDYRDFISQFDKNVVISKLKQLLGV